MAQRLNQVVAIERRTKPAAHNKVNEIYKLIQKQPQLFQGRLSTFFPLAEDEQPHLEKKELVQMTANYFLGFIRDEYSRLFDLTRTKDAANCEARADVVVGDEVFFKDMPVTTLLFLGDYLDKFRDAVKALPILDPGDEWKFDENAELWKTDPRQVVRTKKSEEPLVLFPPTDKHPAQVKTTIKDMPVGNVENIKLSGAIHSDRKRAILKQVRVLHEAVTRAREEANAAQVEALEMGDKIFDFLLAED